MYRHEFELISIVEIYLILYISSQCE